MRFKNILINSIHHSGISYPVPCNLSYWWNFGVLGLVCLLIQILTGIFLAMHYIPTSTLAFSSVEYIMRDINYGWLLRYMHANGASMFFLVIYIHIFRNLYYGSYSYPRNILWCTGVIILLIMILTAFMGYVLPWGQMSFWAATVITNLVSAVPIIGQDILIWLWGGFAVDNATLNRFFSFHYLFPFILAGLVGIHLIYLHEHGSNNFLGIIFKYDKIPFTPYFTIKDIYGIILFFILYSYFIFFDPVYLGHPDNFIVANPLVTPNHIVPEWYFLPFYAILRSVPNKLIGVLLLLASILILLIFPFFTKANIVSGYFRPFYQYFFWLFFYNCLLLGWIGGKVIEEPFYFLGQLFTWYYFLYFIFFLPILGFLEKKIFMYVKVKSYLRSGYKLYSYTNIYVKNYYFIKNISKIPNSFFNINIFTIFFFSIIIWSQSLLLYCFGERAPAILTFMVFFIIYILAKKYNLLENLSLNYMYKKNIWFLSYIFSRILFVKLSAVSLTNFKKNFNIIYFIGLSIYFFALTKIRIIFSKNFNSVYSFYKNYKSVIYAYFINYFIFSKITNLQAKFIFFGNTIYRAIFI